MSSATLRSGVIRAVRSFVTAFIVIEPVSNLTDWASGRALLDVGALRAAGVAGAIAAGSFVWRTFIDPLPVPTLADRSPYPAQDGNDTSAARSTL